MRFSAASRFSPERASSTATPSLASGERSSCEISSSSLRSAATRVSMRLAIRSKVRASCPSSSRRVEPTRAYLVLATASVWALLAVLLLR